ncbi:hypothetical protein ACPA54_18255 [Uniformispora flossi]|uniref:hypothetical protein n=1 Tax=Uniformispora flossi TaxID=3390723 RepID=UPI003C2D8268
MPFLDRFRAGRPAPPQPTYVTGRTLGLAPLLRACQEVRRTGGFALAAELLAAVGDHWDYRATAVDALAEAAITPRGVRAIESWRKAAPGDGDMPAVRAEAAVQRAWRARGSGPASHTSREGFAAFFRHLPEAEAFAIEATAARPDDPTPWVTLMRVTRGLRQPRAVFDSRWDELTARDPHNARGTAQAMQYPCDKWYGSHAEMYAFARDAASRAPAGSPVKLLVVEAHVEEVLRDEWASGKDLGNRHGKTPDAQADLDAALREWPDGHGHGYPTRLRDRSFLAYACAESRRWRDFARQVTDAGHRVWQTPWEYRGGSAYVRYAHRCAVRVRGYS